MRIREARVEDATATAEVHRRSIRELCSGDYSAQQIDAWIAGTSKDSHLALINNPELRTYLAEEGGAVIGVGVCSPKQGTVNVLYVAPECVRAGVGAALLERLEKEIQATGGCRAELHSSLTSVSFYRARGYCERGTDARVLISGIDLPCVSMEKQFDAVRHS